MVVQVPEGGRGNSFIKKDEANFPLEPIVLLIIGKG